MRKNSNNSIRQATIFLTAALSLYITTTTWRVNNLHQRVIELERMVRVK